MFIVELLSSVLVLLVVRLNKAKVFENLLLLVDGMTEILIMFSLLQTVTVKIQKIIKRDIIDST